MNVSGRPRPASDETPPGWTANPSSWSQRLPIVALALAGVAIATYLALYQLGLIATVWEPFFGAGSRIILESSVSRVLPVPDAVLGALGYLILQPVLFDAWCTLCLASAVISVTMIGPALDEVLASLQHLRREHDAGGAVWRAFWGLGEDRPGDTREPARRRHLG